ncbi:monocarboxylate transporter 12-B-like [Uloborus diversus]|uniref:monocarboxylate transporter 12-B-like n=1 Tax=Uloborus diversus TaxID=327109 RepID=UPI002409242A|nr:monocarboxylate transporter 12-B-like [Uloborus diversus]XP_054718075.1 monocarboxylate transporter 12-B-like [Uloborus diversus]
MTAIKELNNSAIATSPDAENRRHVEEEEEEEEVEYVMPEPPDGGWGWVVVFCSFMIHVIADGVTYTFGIFHMEFLRHFGESNGATSWVSSIMVGTTFCVGPFASGLTNQFGCRTVTIIGSLLATFGLIMSTIAPSVTFLYFSAGLCTGCGFGLMYLPAIVCVTCYFERRRAFATGIAVCGSGIGTFLLAPVIQWMVGDLGWQGAMLVTAGFVLNCCVFGALFRPLQKKPVLKRLKRCSFSSAQSPCNGDARKCSLPNGTLNSNGDICIAPLKIENLQKHSSLLGIDQNPHHFSSVQQIRNATSMTLSCGTTSSRRSSVRLRNGPMARKDIFYSGSVRNLPVCVSNLYLYDVQVEDDEKKEPVKKSTMAKFTNFLCPTVMREAFTEMMNFRLMTDVVFLMFGFSNFFTNIGFNVPFVYTKDRAVGLDIADEKTASYLLSVIGIANTVARVILGYLSDHSCVNRLWLYNASLTFCGIATAFSALCKDYSTMALYAAVFGATAGAYVSLTSVILVDLLGLDKLTNSFGLLLLFEGVACLIGPPITGWLHDYTGSYDPGFYVSGAMIAVSGLMLFYIPCVQRYFQKNKHVQEHVDIVLSPTSSLSPKSGSPVKDAVLNRKIFCRSDIIA